MTHTSIARAPMVSTPAGSNLEAAAGRVAILAAAAAFLSLLSLHVLSPEFSPAWRMISEYATGSFSWVLSVMFLAYGLSALALAFAIRSQMTTRRDTIGLALLVVSGIGAASAAQFDLTQAAPHELAGVLGIFGLPVAAMLISSTLANRPGWTTSRKQLLLAANLTWISVVIWIASFGLMVVTFLLAMGGTLPTTPPAELPAGVIALVGWTNRLTVLSAWGWLATVAWHVR